MRRYILPILAIALTAAPAAVEAQAARGDRGPAPGRAAANPAAHVLEHREALGLTLDQVRQLQQIQARVEQQNQPLAEQLRAAAPAMARGIGQQARQLTPEQREQMRAQMTPERRAEMRAQMGERRAEMTPEQRAEMQARMEQRRAEVTPEQRERMRTQMQARRGAMHAGRGPAGVMNPEVRQQMEALRPVMQQLQANTRQAQQDVQAVLTTAQREQLRAVRQEQAQQVRERVQGARDRGTPGQRPALRRGPGR